MTTRHELAMIQSAGVQIPFSAGMDYRAFHVHMKENTMAKAATKKRPKTSTVSKPKKAPAAKSSRVKPAKPVRAAKAPVARKPTAKANVPAKRTRAARAPVISKDELRNQIEKLTAANLALKTKSRESAKALKAAKARIEVLEHQIRQAEAETVIDDKPSENVRPPRESHLPKSDTQPLPEAEGSEETE